MYVNIVLVDLVESLSHRTGLLQERKADTDTGSVLRDSNIQAALNTARCRGCFFVITRNKCKVRVLS
jgi:hypothetical protein